MDASDFRSQMTWYAAASRMLSFTQQQHCNRLVVVLSKYMDKRRNEFVMKHAMRPVLCSYSSDATSFLCREQVNVASDESSCQRRGRLLTELFSERAVLKSITPSGPDMFIWMRAARCLEHGKCIPHLFDAACASSPALRPFCSSVIINHVCFDRAVHSGLSRLLSARSSAYYDTLDHEENQFPGSEFGDLKEWFLETGCAAHDASGSLKWGMHRWTSESIHDNVFIAIESLRNIFVHLVTHLPMWLPKVVSFSCTSVCDDSEGDFWRLMGVPADMIDDFAAASPRWSQGQLHVRSTLESHDRPFELISFLVIYSMRWRKFCMTRWLTVGLFSRALICSLCLGIDDLVRFVRENQKVSEYHAHGWDRFGEDEFRYTMIVALGSYPCEAWLSEIVVDDRLGARAEELQLLIEDELAYLHGISQVSWERLSSLSESWSWHQLRHRVLICGQSSSAYLNDKSLKHALGRPWSLCRGDIHSNLEQLRGMTLEEGTDKTTKKIKALLEMGVSVLLLLCSQEVWAGGCSGTREGDSSAARVFFRHLFGESLV